MLKVFAFESSINLDAFCTIGGHHTTKTRTSKLYFVKCKFRVLVSLWGSGFLKFWPLSRAHLLPVFYLNPVPVCHGDLRVRALHSPDLVEHQTYLDSCSPTRICRYRMPRMHLVTKSTEVTRSMPSNPEIPQTDHNVSQVFKCGRIHVTELIQTM